MTIPITCLYISRQALGFDDPLSDNISANVIGLGLANAARFVLFRTLVFRSPLVEEPVRTPQREPESDPTH